MDDAHPTRTGNPINETLKLALIRASDGVQLLPATWPARALEPAPGPGRHVACFRIFDPLRQLAGTGAEYLAVDFDACEVRRLELADPPAR